MTTLERKEYHYPKPVLLLMSGGLDSVTLAYDLKQQGCLVHAVLFDYGQVHVKELKFAVQHCKELEIEKTTVELHRIKGLFQRSALTDGNGGDVVPNRNSVFIHIAAGIAVTAGAEAVAIGCNKDDQNEFPDCTWDWLESVNETLKASKIPVEAVAPYIGLTKWQIVRRAKDLGVDLDSVWWCYKDGPRPCRRCLSCKKMEAACA